ncbi:GABA-specific high-affinity permease [Saitozyma podzolica]|uniref:GABA-specific high-affinity permease n=1 Tax=Saitozyma podzolica TaxID=1890683 RepID=A0A427YKP6_9TREE|nr:GABA-specific high-affinity permease [Saitozyma podzolica]
MTVHDLMHHGGEDVQDGTALQDDTRLETLGYRPELKRSFSRLETFGVAFSIMGVVPSIASTIFYNLPYGGPVSMIWGWVVSSVLIMFIGLAMGDLASSMPTSGGLYFWTHRLSPPKYRNFLAWMVGYNSFLGNVAAISSLAWACAGIFFAAVSINNQDFSATAAQTFGLYCGILIFCGVYCAYFTGTFARMQTPSVVLNVALALATIIGLPIARKGELNTAEFTFAGFTNLTGWPSGFAFILSFLAPVWTICSFDCAVSISEEASNAAYAVPQAIVGAIGSAGVLGTVILIILALTMGPDVAAVNDSALGQPLAYIYLQAFGTTGSLVMWSFICISQISMTASLVLPSSRQAFAFARDGALPFSKFFYKVDSWTGTPVRTVWLVVGCAMPLGLLCFADPVNYSAINAIFTLAILGPYVAYGIPILSRVLWGTPTSSAVHGTSAVSPSRAPSSLVAAGVWAFAIGFWFFPKIGGKTFFTGPATHDLSAEIEALARGQTIENHDIKKDSAASSDRNEVVAVETISE